MQNIKTTFFVSLTIILMLPIIMTQHTEGSSSNSCPAAGFHGENRCYAVKKYLPDGKPLSINVDIIADDISVTSGFLQNSLWSHLSDMRFVESGFSDQSSDSEKILCGENGFVNGSAIIKFSDGHKFNTYVYSLRDGMIWKIGTKHYHSNTEKFCTAMSPSGTYVEKLVIGSEATRSNNPDYEHEWDDLEINRQDAGSDDFTFVWVNEYGPGYKVKDW